MFDTPTAHPPFARTPVAQLVCAVYLRYSSDEQRPTSIEDQLRRCRETAARLGLTIDERRIYADAAVTGQDSGLHKRLGYQEMKQAAEDKLFDVLICDEFSRLSRDMLEGSVLAQTLVRSGIRLVTADGLDTQDQHWRMPWMIKAFTAEHELQQLVYRIRRGTDGQLKRGYQVGPPPYGYRSIGLVKADANVVGARWEIVPTEAEVIKEIYAARAAGLSYSRIAADLQRRGVPPRGVERRHGSQMWRPNGIHSLVRNPIYKGVYTRNGSHYSRAAARKAGVELNVQEYPRPEYRIVSDDVWADANGLSDFGATQRQPHGTRKRLLSGMITCGRCGTKVATGSDSRSRSMYCQRCYLEHRHGLIDEWIGYTSENSALQALHWAIRQLLTPEVQAEFALMLRQALESGPVKEVAKLNRDIEVAKARVLRLKRALTYSDLADDVELIQSLTEANREVREKKAALVRIEAEAGDRSPATLERQLAVNLSDVVGGLLDAPPDAAYLQAVLRRLVSRFAFVAHDRRHHARFEIEFALGEGVAAHTGTKALTQERLGFCIDVTTSGHRPVRWQVSGTALSPKGD